MAPQLSKQDDRRKRPPVSPRRLGPRPLPLHLGMAALTWTASQAALPSLRSGSGPWNPALGPEAAALRASLAEAEPDALARAVAREAVSRHNALVDGIEAYRRHPYRRELPDPPVIWSEGRSRLLDYGAPDHSVPDHSARDGAIPLLVVPSLINRAYILDLSLRSSLLRWLAGEGFRPLLMDWGAPGAEEREFSLSDYIAGRLERALDHVVADTGRPPLVLGYCMGGLLALALALRRQDDLAGLALLATPWDFHADGAGQARLAAGFMAPFEPLMDLVGELPVDVIQAFFAGLDPMLVLRKFLGFARLDPTSPEAEVFVALEDWLNDGVALAAPVARECLAGWYGANTTAAGKWQVGGETIDPAALALATLCLIPAQDRIVPPASAEVLGRAIPDARTLRPATGHIGMVVSSRSERHVWRPLAGWLRSRSS